MENFRKYSNNIKNNSIQILQIDFIYYEKSGINSFSNCIKTKSLFKMHIVKSTFILYTVVNITITNKRRFLREYTKKIKNVEIIRNYMLNLIYKAKVAAK